MPLGRLAISSAMGGYIEEGPATPPLEPESKIAAAGCGLCLAIVLGDVEEAWNGAVKLIVDFDGEKSDFADSSLRCAKRVRMSGTSNLWVLVDW